ncbi:MAG: condensation domain-containing protein [Bacteroidota bacterium]
MKSLLDTLYQLGVRLEIQNNDLKIKAPQGVLTPFHIQEIKKYKEDLIALLSAETTANIPKAPSQTLYPLTSAQKRIWMLSQFEKASSAYQIVVAYQIEGLLDTEALTNAFQYVIDRHDSLRTTFVEKDGEVFQQITPAGDYNFSVEYVQATDASNITQYYEFDLNLEKVPVLGARVLQIAENKHFLIASLHHCISDGWSMEIFSKEIIAAYNAYHTSTAIQLPALTIQYPDYAVWKNKSVESVQHQKAENYWLKKFQGELPSLQLPTFTKRPLIKTYQGKTAHFTFSSAFYESITQFSKKQDVTLFVTLLAGINAFLYRYTDQEDIILGTPVAGREHPELQQQIGLFINTIAIRTHIASDVTFARLVQQEKDNLFEAYQHQSYPFDELIEKLQLKRDLSRSALFDVMVVLQSQTQLQSVATNISFEGLQTKSHPVDAAVAMFDLSFAFVESTALKLALNYNTDIYSDDFIHRFLAHFERFMHLVLTTHTTKPIRQINYLSEEEIKQQVITYNATETIYPKQKTLVDLFAAHCLQIQQQWCLLLFVRALQINLPVFSVLDRWFQ